ncbi:hypothetical protein P7K49_000068 [Saguinus oedipus]|uniref:Lysosome-associated membrane glycoprotein 1 n=1 Tax=Saguinus oedipus TaxID=9490 RepID=A0ABQ9WAL9_SAGOE|nr:hypothetical protein P7K49_000068 [Saguinus oedipus]
MKVEYKTIIRCALCSRKPRGSGRSTAAQPQPLIPAGGKTCVVSQLCRARQSLQRLPQATAGPGAVCQMEPDTVRVLAVEECLLDENNMLIPIAVGGALAGLVLIVLIAYLVGRKRSHAGYQTI